MYQLQKHAIKSPNKSETTDRNRLLLQKKIKSKRLHCRIIKQLQKCKVPINISEESVNEVKKKISFRISNTERLKLHKIQPLFACG